MMSFLLPTIAHIVKRSQECQWEIYDRYYVQNLQLQTPSVKAQVGRIHVVLAPKGLENVKQASSAVRCFRSCVCL
ncbi:Hypothetical predicted protein [Cloeon dipterum]|uniref:Uncharacterized protein n=1 Tax=Cloeon dipterum TaxID=197152 RepID=A0A8S1DM58_9INSE|nr:Hypothetical predicted protein [Cloeon dipterum]